MLSERQAEADLIQCLNIKPSATESPLVGDGAATADAQHRETSLWHL